MTRPIDPDWVAYCEDMQGKVRGVLIEREPQLAPNVLTMAADLVDHNDFGVALEIVIDALDESRVAVDPQVQAQIDRLMQRMGLSQ